MSPQNALEPQPKPMFGRFRLLEELGMGAHGRVVRAFDLTTRRELALKILHLYGAEPLARFKNEFRTLAELTHPNLVRLGELFEHDQVWAFSMELVRGQDFVSWVRPSSGGFSEQRLRGALAQLASALHALHAVRLVHRDIKPENVRVTPEGRVVVLDFGLVSAHGPSARTTAKELVGTVGYMAPELANREVATEKADLYALGVMLYQALTGQLPFEGDFFQVAYFQRMRLPDPPSSLCEELPGDLDALCMALLAPEPERRPSAGEVRKLLGTYARSTTEVARREPRAPLFFGRDAELEVLRAALVRARTEQLRTVVIRGGSGIGKSALVAELARGVRREVPDAVIVSGRCHVAEHVSYNAFDDIVDELARLLSVLPAPQRDAMLPASAHLLPTLFPALARIPGIAARGADGWSESARVHLFDALIDLLARLGRQFPLLITIDDLQWADADSVQLLRSMLDRGRDLRLLLVLTARSERPGEEAGPPARALFADPRVEPLELAPLDDRSARALGAELLAASPHSEQVTTLISEAGGSPIFLIELAHAHPGRRGSATLDDALRARVALLDPSTRRLLELVCVAGAPVPVGVVIAALETSIEALYRSLALLRRDRLLVETPTGELMSYHDRVREAVVSGLPASTRTALHALLASAFERKPFQSALRAAQHFLLAGDDARAAPWLELAAATALESAVFEQAAELYRQRLAARGAPLDGLARRALQLKLADALAYAGHCSESASVLLEALDGASSEQRRALSLRAAQQLLQAGELGPGMRAAARALEEVGLPWRGGASASLVHLGLHRMKIRATRARLRKPAHADALLTETRLDTIMRLTQPLAWSDLLRSMELNARGLLLAIDEQRADYLPLLLAAEAVQMTLRNPSSEQGEALLAEASSWLSLAGESRERAYVEWASGATKVVKTKYAEAERHLWEAERLYREVCPSEAWMQVNARGMLLNCLLGRGGHREFVACAELWIREAQSKGNAYAHSFFAVGGQAAFRHVIADQPGEAMAEVEAVMRPWEAMSWGIHHFLRLKTTHDILSYVGGDRAHAWWSEGVRVGPLAPAFFAESFAWRRADAALRAGIARGSRALVRTASRMVKPLAHAATPHVRVFAGLTAMQIALQEGRHREARRIGTSIEQDVAAQDDFRTLAYDLLQKAVGARRPIDPAHWDPMRAWFSDRGWRNPERALCWVVPIALRY